ncbi:MAG TPA: helix-turn-helix transcriptional regulator [Candidatus Nitrosotenuis sp.]|nr:helix-turn-helix transcriptional regulator [Candidatus Nitrosotenuis sp.]
MDTDFTRRSPENHSDTLAERLRRLRQQAGLSQAELARRSGVSRSHICGIEQGVSASPSALYAWRLPWRCRSKLFSRQPAVPGGRAAESCASTQVPWGLPSATGHRHLRLPVPCTWPSARRSSTDWGPDFSTASRVSAGRPSSGRPSGISPG